MQYILEKNKPFTGSCISFILEEDNTVAYTKNETFEEYCKNNPDREFIFVDLEEMHRLQKEFYDDICSTYEDSTADDWDNMLGCVPPYRYKNLKDDYGDEITIFFCGEPYISNIHRLCIYDKKDDKFYSKYERILKPDEQIFNNFSWHKNRKQN